MKSTLHFLHSAFGWFASRTDQQRRGVWLLHAFHLHLSHLDLPPMATFFLHACAVGSFQTTLVAAWDVVVMSETTTAIPPSAFAPRSFEEPASSPTSEGPHPRFLCAEWTGRGRTSELDRRRSSCDGGGESTPRQSWRKERRVARPWRCACEVGGAMPPRNRSGTERRDERAATRRRRRDLQSAWSDAARRVRRNWLAAEIRAG